MRITAILVRIGIAAALFSLGVSCQHDLPPTCEGVDIQVDAVKTDAYPHQANGTIVITASGTSKYFTYSLDTLDYQASDKFTGLDSGTYIIHVRNSWGCKISKEVRIAKIDSCGGASFATTATHSTLGKQDGTIVGVLTGGSDATFKIEGGAYQTSPVFNGLSAGNYLVTAQYNKGCLLTSEATVGSTDPCAGVTVAVAATTTDPLINQSNGKITVSATGASNFNYNINGGVYQANNVFSGLPAGNYTITAKSADGCIGTTQAVLNSFNPCTGATVAVTTTFVSPILTQSNGSITANATGGTGFNYSLNGGAYQAGKTFGGLVAGNYTIAAKSADGCIGTTQVTLSAVNPCTNVNVMVAASVVGPTLTQSNGSITANATGGTGFNYSLNGGAYQASKTFSGLAAGNYTITAKSADGCMGTTQVSLISVNPCTNVNVVITTSSTNPVLSQSNGSITVSASGGSSLFTYNINGGAFQSGGMFSNLASGNYLITAKNADGCTGSTQVVLNSVNPCANYAVVVTTTVTNPDVNLSNGIIIVSATGGTTGFTYSLNGGAYQVSSSFTGLATGNYTLTAKNGDGCTGTTQVALGAANPCAGVSVVVSGNVTDASIGQSNGSITASATGGTGFTYSLNNGTYQASGTFSSLAAGNYTITAKTSAGCLGSSQFTVGSVNPCAGVTVAVTGTVTNAGSGVSNGSIVASATGGTGFTFSLNGGAYQASGTFFSLAAGVYTITAKNSNGCQGSSQFTIGTINPCAGVTVAVTATVTGATIGLSNGSIVVSATGGSGFTYSLNGGAYQASGTFSALAAGNYTITAKNSNGCLGSGQFTVISIDPCAGVTVSVTATITNATLAQSNGSIVATATGGSGFTHSLNGGAYQASGTFSALAAGNYTITAKNSNGCLGSKSFTVTSVDPCAGVTVTVTGTGTNATTGQSNGSIAASATGGSGFTYSLNGGAYQASGTFSGLAAGNYSVTAKNSNGCLGSATFTVTSVNPCTTITITFSSSSTTSVNCLTPGTGTITVTASGSTGFTYNLNSGAYQASGTFSALIPGTYTMGAKDVNGCTATTSVVVSIAPAGPLFTALKTLILTRCNGSGCHTNGQTQKGYNFDTDCKIVNAWSGINGACITGSLGKMPISPQPNLTTAEKKVITDWLTAGHVFEK